MMQRRGWRFALVLLLVAAVAATPTRGQLNGDGAAPIQEVVVQPTGDVEALGTPHDELQAGTKKGRDLSEESSSRDAEVRFFHTGLCGELWAPHSI
jgi:hypothetical protein